MPQALIRQYLDDIDELEAEEVQIAMIVSDWPYMSPSDRRKTGRDLLRYLPTAPAPKIDTSTVEGQAQAARLGIVVETEVES